MEIEYAELGSFRGQDLMLVASSETGIHHYHGRVGVQKGRYVFRHEKGVYEIKRGDSLWEGDTFLGHIKN